MKSQQLRNNSRACSTLRNMSKVHRITWISAEGPGRLLPGVRAETEWRTGNPKIIRSRSGDTSCCYVWNFFRLVLRRSLRFSKMIVHNNSNFIGVMGHMFAFNGGTWQVAAASMPGPTHTAIRVVIGDWLTQQQQRTQQQWDKITRQQRGMFLPPAKQCCHRQRQFPWHLWTLEICVCFPSARCWLRHENRTRLNGPSSRQRSQSSWAGRTLHERAARKASNEKRSTEILNTMGPKSSPNDNG